MKAYCYLAKMKLLVSLTYRFEVLTSFASNLIIIICNYFLWKTAYSGIDSVKGVNESQMITYAMISTLLNSLFSIDLEMRLQNKISKGDIAIEFFRPVNFLLCLLAEDIGQTFSSMLSKVIPLLATIVIFIHSPLPANPVLFVIFIISTVFSFLMLWTMSAIIALTSFWVIQLANIVAIKDGILFLLSGKIIPLWLFPEKMQNVINFLPFKYIYQTPLSIYIGKLSYSQTIASITVQIAWIVLLGAFLCFGWDRAKRHVSIQGG